MLELGFRYFTRFKTFALFFYSIGLGGACTYSNILPNDDQRKLGVPWSLLLLGYRQLQVEHE